MSQEPNLVRPADILQSAKASASVGRVAEIIGRQIDPGGTPYGKVRLGYVQTFDPATWTCTALIGDLLTVLPGIPVLGHICPANESAAMFLQTSVGGKTEYLLIGTMPKDPGTPTYGQTWRIRKTAEESVLNSASAISDAELRFTGQAGRTYLYDALLLVTQNGTTTAADVRAGWALPSGATFSGGAIGPISSLAQSNSSSESTGAGVNWRAQINTVGTFPYGTDPNTGGTENYPIMVRLQGSIKMGATPGICAVAWAQQTAQGGITTRVKEGSFLKVDMTSEYTL